MDKQEPINEEIKLEPPEDTWNDQEIKLEPLEIEKEELLDWPPKLERMDDPLELLKPKLEELDNHEMSRPSEPEYPDYIKLEPREEPDNNSRRTLHSSSSTSTRQTPLNRKCAVCSGRAATKSITQICSKDRRLVLMVGLVLSRKKTVEEARWLMSLKQVTTCRNHVAEAIHAIYEALKIKNIHELKMRSTENMAELMNIVHSIDFERMDFARFEQILMDMVWRINPWNGDIEKPVQQSAFPSVVIKRKQLVCSLCKLMKNESSLIEIDQKTKRLVLLSEAVLNGKMLFESARPVYRKARRFRVCKTHLSDVVNSILKLLNINKIENFWRHSKENMRDLMVIAGKMNRNFTVNNLHEVLINFEEI